MLLMGGPVKLMGGQLLRWSIFDGEMDDLERRDEC